MSRFLNKITKPVIYILLFIGLNLILFVALFNVTRAYADDEKGETDKNIVYWEDALKIGKYYLDGDRSLSYVEVYDDGTLQLKEFDYEGFVYEVNKSVDVSVLSEESLKIREEGMAYEREWLSSRHKYAVLEFKNVDYFIIAFDYTEGDNGIRGFNYIDDENIGFAGMKFIYIGE